MNSPHLLFLISIVGMLMFFGMTSQVHAQTEEVQQQPADAAFEQLEGEERTVELEGAITAEPARPLIQFTYSRPDVLFAGTTVRQRTRNFYTELRKGSSMEVGPPVIDDVLGFPDGPGDDWDPLGIGPGVIQNLEERQELLDRVEEELEDIRQQRIKAQRELEEMKKSMEEDPG